MEKVNSSLIEDNLDASLVANYLIDNPDVSAEIITATLAMILLVSASKDFSRDKLDIAKKKILGGSSMLTASAFLAGNLQYALPDLGIFLSSNGANLVNKYPKIPALIAKELPEKVAQNLHISVPAVFASAIFFGLVIAGVVNSVEAAIVPAGLGTLAVSYSLLKEKDRTLRRVLAIIGGSLIVVGGANDFADAMSHEINIKGAILSAVYTILNVYFTAAEIKNYRLDTVKK